MTTIAPLTSMAHALAALDAFPIAGSMWIDPDAPGVDFDALERARRVLAQAWHDTVPLTETGMTPQGGITLHWSLSSWSLELTVDPFSVYDFRAIMPTGYVEWTRGGFEIMMRDIRAFLSMMASGEESYTARVA